MSADALNRITSVIVGAAIDVHRALGAGLLEAAYLGCLCFELTQRGLRIETQKPIPLIYHGVRIERAFRADLIVEECVIVKVSAWTSGCLSRFLLLSLSMQAGDVRQPNEPMVAARNEHSPDRLSLCAYGQHRRQQSRPRRRHERRHERHGDDSPGGQQNRNGPDVVDPEHAAKV